MFTGIVTDIGVVHCVRRAAGGDARFEIETPRSFTDLLPGASIALAGACMTVVDRGEAWFGVDVSDESLSKTTLGEWKPGRRLNLERALKVGDELGGHYVTGHVDGRGRLSRRREIAGSLHLVFCLPKPFHRFVAPKASIALDGVSLTVNEVGPVREVGLEDREFTVNIIPHTAAHTTLGDVSVGDFVNFEVDILARYMARLMETAGNEHAQAS